MSETSKFKMNWGIVVYHPNEPDEIIHFCGYEERPTMNDVKELTIELMTDEEFGLQDHIESLVFRFATYEEVEWANSGIV
jgi:hypothetical protein